MERPLCPLCGTKHYAREAHVFPKNVVSESNGMGRASFPIRSPGRSGVEPKEVGPRVEPATPHHKDSLPKFDRTAYQRDYMRFWRAKKAGRAVCLPSK